MRGEGLSLRVSGGPVWSVDLCWSAPEWQSGTWWRNMQPSGALQHLWSPWEGGAEPGQEQALVWMGALGDPVPDPACSPSGKNACLPTERGKRVCIALTKNMPESAVKINKKESLCTMESGSLKEELSLKYHSFLACVTSTIREISYFD